MRNVALALLLLCFVSPSFSQTKKPARPAVKSPAATAPTTKEQDIRKLLDLTGTREMVEQMKTLMVAQVQQGAEGLSTEMVQELLAAMKPEDLIESMIPVYEQHFTAAEIKQLLAFYQSPVGKKVITEMPEIMKQSSERGIAWGEKAVDEVVTRWKKEGKISERAYEQLHSEPH